MLQVICKVVYVFNYYIFINGYIMCTSLSDSRCVRMHILNNKTQSTVLSALLKWFPCPLVKKEAKGSDSK